MNKQAPPFTAPRLFAIGFIFCAISIAWLVLGNTLSKRHRSSTSNAKSSVTELWGPEQSQVHPEIWYIPYANASARSYIQPVSSSVDVKLHYEPKKKGLSWNNTYSADFSARYEIKNNSDSPRLFNIVFSLPSSNSSYRDFTFKIDDDVREDITPSLGVIKQTVSIPAQETSTLEISYLNRGMDQWSYHLGEVERIQDFHLNMQTNFENIDFPAGSSSPTSRDYDESAETYQLTWNYSDVINPQHIAMRMPEIKDAALIASKISFFAPISLLFFFAIMIIFGLIKGVNLHPMNYVFLAAGFFSFHLLFSYLVDLLPLHLAFVIAAGASLLLIGSYVHALGGKDLLKIALPAQFTYLVLFSYSFLFKGVTGLTIALGSVITLALVMRATAKIDWAEAFSSDLLRQKRPRKVPQQSDDQPATP